MTPAERPAPAVADLAGLVAGAGTDAGRAWSVEGRDLRASLVVIEPGGKLAGHINQEADVLLVGVSGRGSVEVDGVSHPLEPHRLVHVPKSLQRQVSAAPGESLAVLVVHRRTRVSSAWRWRPRRRKPWEDPWEEIEAAAGGAAGPGSDSARSRRTDQEG